MDAMQRMRDFVALREKANLETRMRLCQELAHATKPLQLTFVAGGIQLTAEEPILASIRKTLASGLTDTEQYAFFLTEAEIALQQQVSPHDQVAVYQAYAWRKIVELLTQEIVTSV